MVDLSTFFNTVNLYAGQTKRADCPVCQRKNTFTYTREYFGYLYNCYSADCKASGVYKTSMEGSNLRSFLNRAPSKSIPFEVPNYFKPINSSSYCVNMLERYGCEEYMKSKYKRLRYDPKEDRLVFLIHSPYEYEPVDAVGRSFSASTPKWKRYGTSKEGLRITSMSSDITIIVEDCFSAANLYGTFDALALLGTTLTYAHIKSLLGYSNVVICLDKDATSKALEIRKVLRPVLYTRQKLKVYMLQKDIKNMTPTEREEFVSKINGMFK